jgi:hypothetical protein
MKLSCTKWLIAFCLLWSVATLGALAQGTAFTYQGRLASGGSPATGSYDLEFALFNAPTNGTQVANSVTNLAVGVTNGLFTTTVDFGSAYTGSALWLQLGVRPSGGGNFTLLTTLQPLTPVPYALYAETSGSSSGPGGAAGNAWSINGNAGTSPASTNFLGTTDFAPLELWVDGARAFRLEPGLYGSPNVIGGDVLSSATAGATASTIGGGSGNTVGGSGSTVGGGSYNTASGQSAAVGGGNQNSVTSDYSTIGGGIYNQATARDTVVGGGYDNLASGKFSTVAGGVQGIAAGLGSFVGGGGYDGTTEAGNVAQYPAATAVGGVGNDALAWYATVVGGYSNSASGPDSFVGGGTFNLAGGFAAVVPGGLDNVASGDYSFAAGDTAQAINNGAFVWADASSGSPFASSANNQFSVRALGGVRFVTGGAGMTIDGVPVTSGGGGGGSAAPGWSLTGNSGTTPGADFVGTTDDEGLELHVNGSRGLRLDYASARVDGNYLENYSGINMNGGYWGNTISTGVVGATIAGGGYDFFDFGNESGYPNVVSGDFGTIGGGYNNTAGLYATIPGGDGNFATGEGSFAMGFQNYANGQGSFALGQAAYCGYQNCFVWNDSPTIHYATGPNQFDAVATGGFNFLTGGGGGLQITSSGNVGINESGPSQKLEVNGEFMLVDGLGDEEAYVGGDGSGQDVQIGSLNPEITAVSCYNESTSSYMHLYCSAITIEGGSDLAEPFQISHSEQETAAGTVVVIDEANPGRLRVSDQPYDTRVAGVVSGANGIHPGIQMQQQGLLEGGKNIALTGRVYVQADTSNGPIKPGDLLTTSRIPGDAMRVSDHARAQGAILGKAMSALKDGKGVVLVLVTLQ